MDSIITSNLEKYINEEDTLYFLGDLTFKKEKALEFFERFSGIKIHYVIGNHDNSDVLKVAKRYCVSVSNLKDIKIEEQYITLCHYAMRVWNKSHFNSWQLYGHSHGTLNPIGKQHDVGIDNNNYYPLSFVKLCKIMEQKPNNFNYIPESNREK